MMRHDRRNAIVGQLALLLDELHVLDVLLGDDAVIAAHVRQVVKHAGVGVKGFFAAAHQAGDAEQAD